MTNIYSKVPVDKSSPKPTLGQGMCRELSSLWWRLISPVTPYNYRPANDSLTSRYFSL